MQSGAGATGAQAVDRAASLLLAVLASGSPVPFTRLVDSSGLPKSTVSRLLSSLERSALIERTDEGDVVPGDALTAYARRHSPEDELVRLARPCLERLGDATGETINLAVAVGGGVVQIDQVDPRFVLAAVNWVDRTVPFHCSALGKAFLAFGTPLPRGRLARLTDLTITTRAALESDLARARDLGYAVADGELEPGLVAVAAPVLDDHGRAVAGISVSGPSTRIEGADIDAIGRLLVTEARALSALLSRHSVVPGTPRKAGAA
jgi:DNA-binding IclR family transcriptional regulator